MKKVEEKDLLRLLGREPIMPEMSAALGALRGRRILVTGAGGSIGSELSRQLAAVEGIELCLVDQAETPLHELSLQIPQGRFVIANCCDGAEMERVFSGFSPEIVFHAAAYKHVPMMELCPRAAIMNNVGSTKVLADLSVRYGVERFVMVSTDKAVNPTNVMGASKRACELYVQCHPGPTRFVTTRFGNVLGSNGSVVPLFMEQLESGGPLTVTHRDVVRYFMLISEACALVILAALIGSGGEIFVFDMGQPVRIADLARRMIALWGRGHERISYIGLRPGEKLYEEVLTSDELTLPGPHPLLKIARVRQAVYSEVEPGIEELLRASRETDSEAVKALKRLVPEFKSKNSPFEKYDAD
ncbi:MAG: polysaccharide biosynthesis protein [Bacteroidales bacterium]|nr:polysaccharide biosynthesis protein [Bacteroidales bacterium]